MFHAGDGNLHPLVLYDGAVEGEAERAEALASAILQACVDAGGSLTGEHGIGLDKACHMPLMYSPDDLATMLRLRAAFDPDGLCNPGKAFPDAAAVRRGAGPVPRAIRPSARGSSGGDRARAGRSHLHRLGRRAAGRAAGACSRAAARCSRSIPPGRPG